MALSTMSSSFVHAVASDRMFKAERQGKLRKDFLRSESHLFSPSASIVQARVTHALALAIVVHLLVLATANQSLNPPRGLSLGRRLPRQAPALLPLWTSTGIVCVLQAVSLALAVTAFQSSPTRPWWCPQIVHLPCPESC